MTERICPKQGCQFAVSGRCLEGFDPPDTCPYQAPDQPIEEETAAFVEQELVDLPSGEALAEAQAADVSREGRTQLIIIAGPTGSGKTTILTSLFEAFQEAPFANYLFRGSRTLVGFEKRCHLGRREAGGEVARTGHTSAREGVSFLHLDLAFRIAGRLDNTHLLLSDISGELFKRIRDSAEAAREVASLGRANRVGIVVDGEKLVGDERHVGRSDSRAILRSLMESRLLADDCSVDLLITKWDVVVQALQAEAGNTFKAFVDETIGAISTVARGRSLRVHEVAARPPVSAKVPFAHGLPTLLRSWMGHDAVDDRKPTVFTVAKSIRECNRYTEVSLLAGGLSSAYDIVRI